MSEKGFLGIRQEGLVSNCVEKDKGPGGDYTLTLHRWLEKTEL